MFVYHENASGKGSFTRTGDAYAVDETLRIAAVADSPLRGILRSKLRRYPQDDHGYDAAKQFCDSMVDSLKDNITSGMVSKDDFKEALITANKKIKELNESLGRTGKTYLTYDLAETVGVAAIQFENKLIYGGLEDCYVFVLRGESLENIAPFEYQIVRAGKHVEKVAKEGTYTKEFPEELISSLLSDMLWEPVWCNVLRNNVEIKDENDQKVGWGCFTGEKEAESFFQVHEINLEKNDHIFVLSDGMIPILNNQEFVKWFIENVESNFEFSSKMHEKIAEIFGSDGVANKEKTLIYWNV